MQRNNVDVAITLAAWGVGLAAIPFIGWWASAVCVTAALIYAVIGSVKAEHNNVWALLFVLATPALAAGVALLVVFLLGFLGFKFGR